MIDVNRYMQNEALTEALNQGAEYSEKNGFKVKMANLENKHNYRTCAIFGYDFLKMDNLEMAKPIYYIFNQFL